jgi:hypothetical protein
MKRFKSGPGQLIGDDMTLRWEALGLVLKFTIIFPVSTE